MQTIIIAAKSINNVIGNKGTLPWHLPADLRFFQDTINGHFLITGRKSYESAQGTTVFTKDSAFCIITSQSNYPAKDAYIAPSLSAALLWAERTKSKVVYILGGASVYEQAMTIADQLIITEIHATFKGDTFFPIIDREMWKEVTRIDKLRDKDNLYDYSFVRYHRF